ncbi:MAG TPA: flagellar motor protein MotS [Bacillota bacterium]|nr:flagellar motor protein MotS [Bacillota bacterium]
MRRRRRRRSNEGGAPKWMVTYSDMVTLILVFFVLLFSMSQIDLVKFQAVTDSFRSRGVLDFFPSTVPGEYPSEHSDLQRDSDPGGLNTTKPLPYLEEEDEEGKEDSLQQLIGDVERFLDENDLTDVISANRTERGVVLVLQERILFDSGEAVILESGKPFLNKIGELLQDMPNHVKVEGHTDSRPISNYRYPSNWELSGARAGSVTRYLIEQNDFNEERFSIAGYGDTRPAVTNTPENWYKNRRVEIVILENDSIEEETSEENN